MYTTMLYILVGLKIVIPYNKKRVWSEMESFIISSDLMMFSFSWILLQLLGFIIFYIYKCLWLAFSFDHKNFSRSNWWKYFREQMQLLVFAIELHKNLPLSLVLSLDCESAIIGTFFLLISIISILFIWKYSTALIQKRKRNHKIFAYLWCFCIFVQ